MTLAHALLTLALLACVAGWFWAAGSTVSAVHVDLTQPLDRLLTED